CARVLLRVFDYW
nr:immunoglobulin heavy chain junction region [Mus musculus]MBK4184902.1 immunoglobulin heavy chain junction region [Mus musculus]